MIKHFIKTLIIFTGMIALGLLGVFLLNYFDKNDNQGSSVNTTPVAK